MGKMKIAVEILPRKRVGTRPLGRSRRKWKDGIKVNLKRTMYGNVKWIRPIQSRDQWRALVNTVINFWFNSMKSGEFIDQISFC
jgi:hypothetical protein